jgi:hypothetical protein
MDDRAFHPDAPVGKAAKYAHIERERRFLLVALPSGRPTHRDLIEDRYLRGTRIRLRRMTELEPAGGVTYKLTQKIPTATGTPGLITTLYLSAEEYAALEGLAADTLRKVRSSFPPLGVDTYDGPLRGLILAEVEFEDSRDEASFPPPPEAVADVTADVRFTGGRLVTTSKHDLVELLAAFGIDLKS